MCRPPFLFLHSKSLPSAKRYRAAAAPLSTQHNSCAGLAAPPRAHTHPQQELLAIGGEMRGELAPLQDKDVFFLQYGEDEDTLRVGRLVEAKVKGEGGEYDGCLVWRAWWRQR